MPGPCFRFPSDSDRNLQAETNRLFFVHLYRARPERCGPDAEKTRHMKRIALLLPLVLFLATPVMAQKERSLLPQTEFPLRTDSLASGPESDTELLERLRNMPNLEVGKGITFRPRNDRFELTMRIRMQNLLALSFNRDFTLTETEARV